MSITPFSNNPICNTDGLITLSGSPSSGTFSGTGVQGNDLNPANASIGNSYVTYTYTDGNGCTDNASTIVNIIDCVQDPNLVACYPFTGNANDAGPLTVNGTTNGNTVLTIGHDGNGNSAYAFDGNGDYISVPNQGAFNANIHTGLTLSCWIYLDTTISADGGFVSKWANLTSKDQFLLMYSNSTRKAVFAVGNGINSAGGVYSNRFIYKSTWYHVAATWEPNGVHKIYINGVLDKSQTVSAFTSINDTSNTPIYIGSQNPTTRNLKGALDNMKIYGRALNATDIGNLYSNQFACQPVLVTEVSAVESANKMNIYPNPTNSILNIQTSIKSEITISNLLGQIIFTAKIQSSESIDVSDFESGIYFVRDVKTGEVIKFIKQ